MLVKHNLYINPELKAPKEGFEIKDGKLFIKGFSGGTTGLLKEDYNLVIGKKYYVGFVGQVYGKLNIYKEKYYRIISKGNIHYIEHIYSENTKPLHIWGFDTDVVIETFFITDEIPDLVIPNIKDHKEKEKIYPLEGVYKEIQPQ